MKKITSGNKEFLAVEMPEGAENIKIGKVLGADCITFADIKHSYITLPKGNYKITGLCSEIMKSEDLAKGVVDIFIDAEDVYLDYINGICHYYKATDSFASFIAKHSLTESTLLIEKI